MKISQILNEFSEGAQPGVATTAAQTPQAQAAAQAIQKGLAVLQQQLPNFDASFNTTDAIQEIMPDGTVVMDSNLQPSALQNVRKILALGGGANFKVTMSTQTIPSATGQQVALQAKPGKVEESPPFRGVGGAFNRGDDERHDLDPTDWYIVKDGKMLVASIYPRQTQQAIAQGFSRTRAEAKSRDNSQGVAEGHDDEDPFELSSDYALHIANAGRKMMTQLANMSKKIQTDSTAAQNANRWNLGDFMHQHYETDDLNAINQVFEEYGVGGFFDQNLYELLSNWSSQGPEYVTAWKQYSGDVIKNSTRQPSAQSVHEQGVAEAAKWRTHTDAHDLDTDGSYIPKGGIKSDNLAIRQKASKTQSEKDPKSMAGMFGAKYAKKHGVPTKQLMKNIPLDAKKKEQGVAEGSGDKKPYPNTWHDVDPKLGKQVDKMSPEEKVEKGYANPSILKKNKQQGVAVGQGSIVDKCASLAAKYFNSAGLQQQYDIDEFIKINTGDNVVVDKCASLAAKYFNSAGLQQQYDIGEYIKANVKQGVAEAGNANSGRRGPDYQDNSPVVPGRVEHLPQGLRHHADASRYGGTEPDDKDDRLLGPQQRHRLHRAVTPDDLDEQEKIAGRHDPDDFDDMIGRLKKLAGAGPLKTVWDPAKRVYKNVPHAVQPAQQPKKAPQ
jgi:hypothetical protein